MYYMCNGKVENKKINHKKKLDKSYPAYIYIFFLKILNDFWQKLEYLYQ